MGKTLHLYLRAPWRDKAVAGQVNLFNRLSNALPDWAFRYHPDTAVERLLAVGRTGNGLFHMHEPPTRRILCFRHAYVYPFWRFERTNKRWNFDVAHAQFQPDDIVQTDARSFMRRLARKTLGDGAVCDERFIFMPLQGQLQSHRSFQSMSPLSMIKATLAHDPRPIRATLHPNETYSAADIAQLAGVQSRFARFQLVTDDAHRLLRHCACVVTQNSALALTGFMAAKRAVLFARSDFHHIAHSVPHLGVKDAFAALDGPDPDFVAYLHWFFNNHCLDMQARDAETQIRLRLQSLGWQL